MRTDGPFLIFRLPTNRDSKAPKRTKNLWPGVTNGGDESFNGNIERAANPNFSRNGMGNMAGKIAGRLPSKSKQIFAPKGTHAESRGLAALIFTFPVITPGPRLDAKGLKNHQVVSDRPVTSAQKKLCLPPRVAERAAFLPPVEEAATMSDSIARLSPGPRKTKIFSPIK